MVGAPRRAADAKKAREVALFEERRRQYEELAEKDDGKLEKDTVEMAERTGTCVREADGWVDGRWGLHLQPL